MRRIVDAQLKRGFLDICVLAAIARKDSYGYQIIRDAPASLELSESTLYPILKRLAKQHFLSEYTREHNGRLRKYYSITEEGNKYIVNFKDVWSNISTTITEILKND